MKPTGVKSARSDFLWACVSLRNHRLCSASRGKILLRFPWRAASPFTSRKRTTPGEHAHARMHTLTHRHTDMINGVGNWVNFTSLSLPLLVWTNTLSLSFTRFTPLLSSSSPGSSGLTPLILTYLMKCLKPPCGNPSTPIKRTVVLRAQRRQAPLPSFPHPFT